MANYEYYERTNSQTPKTYARRNDNHPDPRGPRPDRI